MSGGHTLVAVLGVSGVGKTRLISHLIEHIPDSSTLRASEIIGEARRNKDPEYLRTLPSDQILQSQELLVRGFNAKISSVRQHLVLLDAHSVIDSDEGYVDMPLEIFRNMGPSGFIHVEDDPDAIVARRLSDPFKQRPLRTVDQVSQYQTRSLAVCAGIAHGLSKPIHRVTSGDIAEFERAIEEICGGRHK